jgi:hypothetical protein
VAERRASRVLPALAAFGVFAAGGFSAFVLHRKVTPSRDPEIAAMQERGRALFFGRALCPTCHRMGEDGTQIVGPNLGVGDGQNVPVGERERHDGVRGIEYVVESIVDPDVFVVPGYPRGVMKRFDEPPISLTDDEILCLGAFLAATSKDVVPLDKEAVARARARIAEARRARLERTAPSAP